MEEFKIEDAIGQVREGTFNDDVLNSLSIDVIRTNLKELEHVASTCVKGDDKLEHVLTLIVKLDIEERSRHYNIEEAINQVREGTFNDDVLNSFSIDVIRTNIKELKRIASTCVKGDIKLQHVLSLIVKLNIEERSRPMEEQFPFLLVDLDQMSENLTKTNQGLTKLLKSFEATDKRLARTERSVAQLCAHDHNLANEMEKNANAVFIEWLKREKYSEVFQSLFKEGVIKAPNGDSIVQWDGMISATKDDVRHLFLLEVKEIAHKSDICAEAAAKKPRRNLDEKIKRTLEYFRKTMPQHFNSKTSYKEAYREQLSVLHEYVNAHISVVYASGLMNSDVVGELHKLVESYKDVDVDIYWAECPRFESCDVTSGSLDAKKSQNNGKCGATEEREDIGECGDTEAR